MERSASDRRTKFWLVVIWVGLALVVLSVVLSSCGDDDDGGGGKTQLGDLVVPEGLNEWELLPRTPYAYADVITMCYDGLRLFITDDADTPLIALPTLGCENDS